MDQFLIFLRDLLKPYVDQYNLSFLITNRKGIPVEVVNESRIGYLDYLQEVLLEPYDLIIAKLADISIPVSYDIQIPGVHIWVVPVKAFEENEYYIWTGLLIEEHNPDHIFNYLSKASHNPHKWSTMFTQMPMISLADLSMLTSRLSHIVDLASQFLTANHNEVDLRNQIDMIHQITSAMKNESNQSFRIPNLLSSLLTYTKGIQWCGFALKIKEDTYRIIEILGKDQANLVGVEFFSGEGFLGQVGLYEQSRSLQSAFDDPRLHLFQQKGLQPHHMYGAPVHDEDGVCGILFAGTLDPHIHYSEHAQLSLQVITDLYGSFLIRESNKTKLIRQKAYLSSLTEVSRVMNTVHDIRRLLFILIDISMNLVSGANASYLIFHESGAAKAQIVSRGIPSDQVESYTQFVLNRRRERSNVLPTKLSLLNIQQTCWGDQVLECLITCQGETRGLLSVSLPDQVNAEEYIVVFETYVYLAGVALERLIGKKQDDQDQKTAALLHEALGCWNPQKYEVSKQIKEIAAGFATYLQLSSEDIVLIKTACFIAPYTIEFIRQQQLSPKVIKLCEEYHRADEGIDQGEHTYSIPCQVMLLSNYRVTDKHSETAVHVNGVERSILFKFNSYILRDRVIDYEISMDEPQSGPANVIDFDALQKVVHISTREKEVLELIVKGFNNRDIAENLFISEHTVKNHITKLFQKLNVTDRAQAIALAYKVGFQS